MRIALNLTRLGVAGRTQLAAVIAKFAPQSAIYQSVTSIKELADKVIASGADVEAKQKDVNNKKKAYLGSIADRDTSDQQLAADLSAFCGAAGGVCKTQLDVENLGLSKAAPPSPSAQLTPPVTVTARTGKEKGSFSSAAKRVPGLSTYIAEVSPEPMTETSFQQVPGTGTNREFSGYESGKGHWVRYCTERGQERSAWSEPVYVVAR
jgi:hypothetical protein